MTYFTGYTKPGNDPSLTYFDEHPWSSQLYAVLVLGNTIVPLPRLALASGLGSIGLYLGAGFLFVSRRTSSRSSIPVALMLFSLGSTCLLTLGRAGFGTDQALTPRY